MGTRGQPPACPEPLRMVRSVLVAEDLLTRMGFHAGALSAGRGLPRDQTSFPVAAIQPCVAAPGLPVASPLRPTLGPICPSAFQELLRYLALGSCGLLPGLGTGLPGAL